MSTLLKLLLVVAAGTIAAWIIVLGLVKNTNDMTDTFTVTTTGYLDRKITDEESELQREIAREQQAQDSIGSEQADADPSLLTVDSDSLEADSDNETVTAETKDQLAAEREEAKKNQTGVQAVDLAYALPDGSTCVISDEDNPRVGVFYRPSSFAVKGRSLASIDKLVELYNRCGGGKLLVLQNTVNDDESEPRLMQQRQDEVKYYLLQSRIPKDDILIPDNL